ncbi:vacuolar protein sorting-associated protein 2-like protein [Pycnococcus provasolii]
MEWLFGKRKTPAELLRENKRMLDKAIRELDRERTGLQNQEKKLVVEMKKMAKQGQIPAVKVMAKSMVRNRAAVHKLYGLKSQLQGVSLKVQTLKSTQAMGDAMRGVTKVMGVMNKQLNLPALTGIMREFERQNERMDMTSEVMGDALDEAFDEEGEEDEIEGEVAKVLDEIGIGATAELEGIHAPTGTTAQAAPAVAAAPQPVAMGAGGGAPPAATAGAGGGAADDAGIDNDLQSRLDALRRG